MNLDEFRQALRKAVGDRAMAVCEFALGSSLASGDGQGKFIVMKGTPPGSTKEMTGVVVVLTGFMSDDDIRAMNVSYNKTLQDVSGGKLNRVVRHDELGLDKPQPES